MRIAAHSPPPAVGSPSPLRSLQRRRIEVIDGREYVVTTLPKDWRLTPSQARKRALWDKLTPGQKAAEIRKRKRKARRRRK